jgi:hypothetical protein
VREALTKTMYESKLVTTGTSSDEPVGVQSANSYTVTVTVTLGVDQGVG